jgi:hypothetical protein
MDTNEREIMFKYVARFTKAEKIIYKKALWVLGGVLLFLVILDASALGLVVFFGLGWYAKQRYEIRKKS